MNRKTYAIALTVLIIAFILVPGVQAYPIENMVIVQPLPDSMVAGSSYEMIITFDNIVPESVSFTVEMTVISEVLIIGYDEIFVDEITLNDIILISYQESPGVFTADGEVLANSQNELSIVLHTAINLMPGTYTFDIDLLGEEVSYVAEIPAGTPTTIDAREETGVVLEDFTSTEPAIVTITLKDDNPHPEADVPPESPMALGIFLDFTTTATEFTTEIRVYYTDEEVEAAGIKEDALRLYYFDGADWIPCEDTGVNTAENYVWARVTHFTVFALFGAPPNQPPVADAGPDQTVYVRRTVYFSGAGSDDPDGTIVSWDWDFGDGSIGTRVSTSHVYYSTGTYTVTLTVTDDEGATDSDTMTVRVRRRPTPPPDTGTLSITTTPVDGEVFVDGTSWGIAPKSREVDIGTYTVTFGDVEGYTTPASQEAVVTKDTTTPITGTYILIPTETGTLSIDTEPVKGEVFIDGISWGTAPQTRELEIGLYDVSFGEVSGYVTPDPVEAEVKTGETIEVTGTYTDIPPDMGVLSVDTEPVKGEVLVEGVSWGIAPQTRTVDPGIYSVSFGEMVGYVTPESVDAVVEPDLTTEVLGIYTEIPENLPPVADAGGPYSCDRYDIILLDGSGSHDPDGDIVSYEWDFGDGTTGTGVNPSHIYSSVGTYTVTLVVTDDEGLTGSGSTTVTVSKPPSEPSPGKANKPPVADAGSDQKALVNRTVRFDGSGSYDPDGTMLSYRWDFGDGATATGVDPSHTYLEPGHYTVTLIVKDNRGASRSDACTVTISELPAPVVNEVEELVPGGETGYIVDALAETNTTVTLNTTAPVTVTIIKYETNPHPDDPLPAVALPVYADIIISDPDAVSWSIYVEMHYTDEDIGDLDESTFGIYYWMDGEWRRCSDTGVDMERNVVWAYMTAIEASGSPILMAGLQEIITPPLPPILSNLIITKEELELGEDITISFDIMNPNNQSISNYTTIQIGEISLLVDIELDAYESKTVTRTLTPLAEGIIDVTVDGLAGSFTVIVLPPPPTPAEFVVSELTALPTEIEEGGTVMISVTVTNIGETEGSYTVEFKVDGETVESETVTIPGDSVYFSSFEKTWSAGTYQVSVEDLTAGFTVSALPEPDFTIYYIVVVIIIVAIVAYWLWKQKLPPFDQAT